MKKYAVISPHLDDGILSCGDYIKKIIDDGNEVTIITVFTGYPKSDGLSKAAKRYHSDCFLSDDSMEHRKEEDILACSLLGCKYMHLNYYECLYRKDKNNDYIYPVLENIYHLDEVRDNDYAKKLKEEILFLVEKYDYILAPLGLGNHADHLMVSKIMKEIAKNSKSTVFFYEEIPYIYSIYKINKRIKIEGMIPFVVGLSEYQWKLKTQAILCYRSQLHIIWKNEYERLKQLKEIAHMHNNNNYSIQLWLLEGEK